METLQKRLGNLLTVKSIVTIVLTAVFAYLTCTGGVTADQFLTVFTVVIAFYFGTQAEKRAQATDTAGQTTAAATQSAPVDGDTEAGGGSQ